MIFPENYRINADHDTKIEYYRVISYKVLISDFLHIAVKSLHIRVRILWIR